MVFRSDHHVLHARLLSERDPLLRIKVRRVKLRRKRLTILLAWNLHAIHQPLRTSAALLLAVVLTFPLATSDGIEPPVDEHAVASVAPPLHVRIVDHVSRAGRRHVCKRRHQGAKNLEIFFHNSDGINSSAY